MIYKMTLKDSADEMTFDLLEVPIVDKDIEGAVDNVTLDGNQYTDYLWLKKQFIQKWSILCDDEYTRLRGFYTRQFENADVPSYRLYYGDDIVRNSTLSGERIELSISGVTDGTMSLTQMDGNIEQTTYTGKNLLEAKMPTTTLNGITCTNNGDGSYTLNGTATAGADFRINQSTAHGEDNLQNYDGTYTLSCNELQNDMQLIVMQNGTWSQLLRMRNSNTPATATFTKDNCFIYVYVAQGKTLSNLRIHPMLEKSATATAYEPFVGGQPSPSPSYPQPIQTVTGRQTVGVVGKNLYDPNSTVFSFPANVSVEVDGDSVKVTALITTTSSNLHWRTPIPDGLLENGKTYTISCVLGSGAYRSLRLQLRNHDGSNAGFSNGFTVTYDDRYTLFVVENPFATTGATTINAGTTCTISNIQVEEGSTATAYEPYHGQSYEINLGSIELCKIGTYQDRIYKSNGKWYIEKRTGKVVLNGSEDWHKSGNTQVDRYWYNIYSGEVIPSFHRIYSDKFFYEYNVPTVNAMWVDVYQTLERLFVNYAPYGTTAVADLKTWLASNPTIVYYPLATPTTTEITNEEVLEGLDSLLLESISVGQHNIYTDTANALPTLTFDLTEYLSKSTTIVPETAVRLTLTDGGVINACGCRKDVQLTMRETIE